jgi:hypothetical protein
LDPPLKIAQGWRTVNSLSRFAGPVHVLTAWNASRSTMRWSPAMQLANAPRTEIEFWSGMIETRPGGAAVETVEETVRARSLAEEKLDLLQPELHALD